MRPHITRKTIAIFASTAGHPAIFLPAAVALNAAGRDQESVANWSIISGAALIAVTITVYSWFQVRNNKWVDMDASNPAERAQLHWVLLPLLMAAASLAWLLAYPHEVVFGLVALAAMVLAAKCLSPWYKASLHTSFATFAASLFWASPAWLVLFVLLTLSIAWSRLYLKRHTLSEVSIGIGIGAMASATARIASQLSAL